MLSKAQSEEYEMNDQNKQNDSSPDSASGSCLFLTTEKMAAYLDCAPRTLMCKRVNGSGPPYRKLGSGKKSAVRYYLPDVLAWLESQSRANTSQRGVN